MHKDPNHKQMQLNHLFIMYIQLMYDAYKIIKHNRMQFNRIAFRCRYPYNFTLL